MKQLSYLLLLSLLFATAACDDDDLPDPPDPLGSFSWNFDVNYGDEDFSRLVPYTDPQGRALEFLDARGYFSNIRLVDATGIEVPISDIELINFYDAPTLRFDSLPEGNYTELRFDVGVPAAENNGNPVQFGDDHPLSVNNGMHWSWATGYIFMLYDGRIDSDTPGDGTPDLGFSYHAGLNDLLRPVRVPVDVNIAEAQTASYTLEIDLERVFVNEADTLDRVAQTFTHSTPPGSEAYQLAERVIEHFIEYAIQRD